MARIGKTLGPNGFQTVGLVDLNRTMEGVPMAPAMCEMPESLPMYRGAALRYFASSSSGRLEIT